MLRKEFDFYLKNQDRLVEKYNGKYLGIVGEEVVGVYDTLEDAYVEPQGEYRPGTFLIQKCTPGDEAYTQIFSRVSFA